MKLGDGAAGAPFLVLGVLLVASGFFFPPGVGGLPGAGFFPQAIGGLMAVMALGLIARPRADGSSGNSLGQHGRQVAGTLALLVGYIALWGTGFFAIRTGAYLVLTLRFLGQGWLPAVGFAAALTAFVYLAFAVGLNVPLE